MQKDKGIYIWWMLESIVAIEEYTRGVTPEFFERNSLIHDACLMQFQHLGETANKMKTYFPDDESLPYRQMIGFRNFIAHDYIGIELMDVWDTIIKDLPELKNTLLKLEDQL